MAHPLLSELGLDGPVGHPRARWGISGGWAGSVDLLLPEGGGVFDPALGGGADAEPEAVGQTVVGVELRRRPRGRDGVGARLHGAPGDDPVSRADAGVGRRFRPGDLRVPGVLHDDGAGTGHVATSESSGTVGTEGCGQARSRGAAPQRVAGGVHVELVGAGVDEGDGPGQVRATAAKIRAVLQCEGRVAVAGEPQGVRHRVVDGARVGETTARAAHGHPRPPARSAPLSRGNEDPGVPQRGIGGLLRLGVDAVEDDLAALTPPEQVAHDVDRGVRVDEGVPGEQAGHVGQGVAGPGWVEGDGEQKTAVVL